MNCNVKPLIVLGCLAIFAGCAAPRHNVVRPPVARPAPAPLVAQPTQVVQPTYVTQPGYVTQPTYVVEETYVVEPAPVIIYDEHRRPRHDSRHDSRHDYDRRDNRHNERHNDKHNVVTKPTGSSKPVASQPVAARPTGSSKPTSSKPVKLSVQQSREPKYHHEAPAKSSSNPAQRSGSISKSTKGKKR